MELFRPVLKALLPAAALCAAPAAFAGTGLDKAADLSVSAASAYSAEAVSANGAAAFHGAPHYAPPVYLPGDIFGTTQNTPVVYSKPAPAEKPGVPALEGKADELLGKVNYSRKLGGFKAGENAGVAITALTGAAAGAGIGWFLLGGAAAAVGLGLAGLLAAGALAWLFIKVFKGAFAASPRRDGFDAKVSF